MMWNCLPKTLSGCWILQTLTANTSSNEGKPFAKRLLKKAVLYRFKSQCPNPKMSGAFSCSNWFDWFDFLEILALNHSILFQMRGIDPSRYHCRERCHALRHGHQIPSRVSNRWEKLPYLQHCFQYILSLQAIQMSKFGGRISISFKVVLFFTNYSPHRFYGTFHTNFGNCFRVK